MSGWALYLFFILDGLKVASTTFLTITIFALVVGLLVFSIGILTLGTRNYYDEPEGQIRARVQRWKDAWPGIWRWWRRVLIPIFCVSLALKLALPSTKQAIAIYVIPKIITAAAQNKDLMELPQDVVKVAKLYLNKVMVKWAQDIEKDLSDTTRAVPVSPEVGIGLHNLTLQSDTTALQRASQAAESAKQAYDKAMQAFEQAKQAAKSVSR